MSRRHRQATPRRARAAIIRRCKQQAIAVTGGADSGAVTAFGEWGRATFDWDTLRDGMYISLIGMAEVFGVLILLGLSIVVLSRLDMVGVPGWANWSRLPKWPGNRRPAVLPAGDATAAVSSPPPGAVTGQAPDAGLAAAIAVSLALAETDSPLPGTAASHAADAGSAWVQSGRVRQMSGSVLPPSRGRGA